MDHPSFQSELCNTWEPMTKTTTKTMKKTIAVKSLMEDAFLGSSILMIRALQTEDHLTIAFDGSIFFRVTTVRETLF